MSSIPLSCCPNPFILFLEKTQPVTAEEVEFELKLTLLVGSIRDVRCSNFRFCQRILTTRELIGLHLLQPILTGLLALKIISWMNTSGDSVPDFGVSVN